MRKMKNVKHYNWLMKWYSFITASDFRKKLNLSFKGQVRTASFLFRPKELKTADP